MEVADKACRGCMYYNSETKMCGLWEVPIGKEHTQTCGRFALKREFKNLGKIKIESFHKIVYEHECFEVYDTRTESYGNYSIYTEYVDRFYFKMLVVEEERKRRNVAYEIRFWKNRPYGEHSDEFNFVIEPRFGRYEYNYGDNQIRVRSSEEDSFIFMEELLEINQIKNAIELDDFSLIPSKYKIIGVERKEKTQLTKRETK